VLMAESAHAGRRAAAAVEQAVSCPTPVSAPGGQRPAAAGSALRHRNFALLWSGQTASIAGNGAFTVAMPLEVLRITNSSLDLALVVSARTVPSVILLLIGGTFVDRLSRRTVMLVSDIVCGISVSLLALLVTSGRAHLWEFFLLSVIFGSASAFFRPASTAIVRDILPADLLVSASSLTSLSESMALYLLGPLTGGILVATIGAGWAFGIDGASFAVSAACLAAMRGITGVKAARSRLLADVMDGLRFCYSQHWLWYSMLGIGAANLVCFVPLGILQPLLVRNVFHAGAIALGVMYAAAGGGGALASLAAARWGTPRHQVARMWSAWAVSGLCAAAIGLSPWLWMAVSFAGLSWGLATYGNILWLPLLQQKTPAELLGRVSSVDWMLSFALSPLGAIASGAAAAVIGVRLTLVAGGALAAAAGGILLVSGKTGAWSSSATTATGPAPRRCARSCGKSTGPTWTGTRRR
jgi:MFS family permease